MKYVGIDYHKRYSVVSIVANAGSIMAESRIEHVFPKCFGWLVGAHAPCEGVFFVVVC